MTIDEMIARLSKLRDEVGGEVEVMCLDGFNAQGYLRTINFGPRLTAISQEDSDHTADCEDRVGETVVQMGYGFY